jgi:two-component system, NarL family, nitrate/nitrite response regulator NarL
MSFSAHQREFLPPLSVSAIIVAPSSVTREGLAAVLSRASYRIIAMSSAIDGIMGDINQRESPTLVVLGMNTEIEDCISNVRTASRRHPSSKIVLVVDYISPAKLSKLLDAGAHGCILGPQCSETLVKCLDLIVLGQTVLPLEALSVLRLAGEAEHPAEVALELTASIDDRVLSDRELEIVRLLVAGETNKTIARRLAISEATVKVHMKAILRKIHVRNRTPAAIWAADHGIAIDEQDALLGDAIIEKIGGIVTSQKIGR